MMLRHRLAPSKLRVFTFEDRIVPAVLLVDDDKAQFPTAPYATIQAAVNASAPGDTIKVAAGLYTEQVKIPATKNYVTIRSDQPLLAVIKAPAAMTGSKAIVVVDGAHHVTIKGFTIKGPSPDLDFGVQVTGGGSATIRNNLITAIRGAALSGAQTGIGVVIGGSGGAKGRAEVEENVITDYQKGGIIVANAGSRAEIEENRIVGAGPTALVAQNGIQVSDGASAEISENSITDNVYTGAGVEAAGIIVSDAGHVEISENRILRNQDGILAEGKAKRLVIEENVVRGSTLDGIVLNESHGAYVGENRVSESGRDGIQVVDTHGAKIVENRVRRNGRDGVHVEGTSARNTIAHNDLHNNVRFDAFDDTIGTGTGGTANHWRENSIGTKNRPGLR